MRKAFLTLAALAALSVAPQRAQAGIVYNTLNNLQFANREIFVGTPGTLDAGDRFFGVLYVNEINPTNQPTQKPPTPEVSGIFDLTVAMVIATGNNSDFIAAGTIIDPTVSGYDGVGLVLFRPTGALGILAGHAAGTMLALYEGGVDTLDTLNDPLKTTADAFAAASDGTFQGSFGMPGPAVVPSDWGAPGTGYWAAVVNYGAAIGLPPGQASPDADFFYGLLGLAGPLVADPLVPLLNPSMGALIGSLTGTGTSILANNSTTGTVGFGLVGKGIQQLNDASAGTTDADKAKFTIFSNDPAKIHPTPEPGTIALALIGGGMIAPLARRHRQRKNASAAV